MKVKVSQGLSCEMELSHPIDLQLVRHMGVFIHYVADLLIIESGKLF